jgi:hypothetical protein
MFKFNYVYALQEGDSSVVAVRQSDGDALQNDGDSTTVWEWQYDNDARHNNYDSTTMQW